MVSALHSGSSGPGFETWPRHCVGVKCAFVSEYSGIRMYSEIYSGYSVPGNTIAGMEIQLFRNIFRLFCSWEHNSRNGNPIIPE